MTEEQARLILGVEPDASIDDIRSAHRRVMRSVHPDTNNTEEAHRLALLANQAREILERPEREPTTEQRSGDGVREYGNADYGESDYAGADYAEADDLGDPELRAEVLALVEEATRAIREYLHRSPGAGLTAESAGNVARAALRRAGVPPLMREIAFDAIAHVDFLRAGSERGYWILDGITIRADDQRGKSPEPRGTDNDEETAEDRRTRLSNGCIGLGWLVLIVNVGALLFENSNASENMADVLMGLQMIVGGSSYRSRKLRALGFASDTAKRGFWELAGLLTAVFCGAGIATRDSGLGIFLTLWVIVAYALAGTAARRRRKSA